MPTYDRLTLIFWSVGPTILSQRKLGPGHDPFRNKRDVSCFTEALSCQRCPPELTVCYCCCSFLPLRRRPSPACVSVSVFPGDQGSSNCTCGKRNARVRCGCGYVRGSVRSSLFIPCIVSWVDDVAVLEEIETTPTRLKCLTSLCCINAEVQRFRPGPPRISLIPRWVHWREKKSRAPGLETSSVL